MLRCHPMKRALLAAAVIAVPTVAHAGYLGLGIGTEPAMNSEAEPLATPTGRSLRILGGMRWGNVSLEGNFSGFHALNRNVVGEHTQYGAAVIGKLSLPFGSGFEGYARLGLERSWLKLDSPVDGKDPDYSGNGWLLGGGFEYRLDALVTNASIFLDYTVHSASLDNGGRTKLDETYRLWTLGFSVGI